MLDEAFDISESADSYALPIDYSSEYNSVHESPEDYGWFNTGSASFLVIEGTTIRVQTFTTGEEAEFTTQIPLYAYLNPTKTFVLDSRSEKAHFQIGPSPIMINRNVGDIVVIEIDG